MIRQIFPPSFSLPAHERSLSLRLALTAALLIVIAAPVVIAQSEALAGQPVTVRKLKDVILEGIAECKSAVPVGDRAALRTCLKGKIVAFLKEQSQRQRAAGTTDRAASPTPQPAPAVAATGDFETVTVVRVVDGDTIELEGGERVRYIGIDTPETVDPRKEVQCFGQEASAKNKELVEGQTVRLEKDVSETDRYGRLLRYVYVGDTLINEVLVRGGYAKASSYPPDVKYQDRLQAAEREARDHLQGLWGGCATPPSATPALKPTPLPSPAATATAGGACQFSCSSPDRDCTEFATHAEAQAFFQCCGFTATNDPMQLDSVGVGDGSACDARP